MGTNQCNTFLILSTLTILSIVYNSHQVSLNTTARNEFDEEILLKTTIENQTNVEIISSANETVNKNKSLELGVLLPEAPITNTSDIDGLVEILDGNQTQTSILEPSFTTSMPSTTTQSSTEFENYSYRCRNDTEVFSNCSNSCPASCEEPTRKPCRNYCWKGCECAPGHVKNYRWKCIPIDECPKCNENEHYRNCGSNCEATCETYQNMPVYCNQRASCKRGCFCNYGFVRDEAKNGTCVPMNECPQKCPENEYWEPNGEPCVRTSENPRPNCLFETLKAGCVCNTGYRRNTKTLLCEPISKLTGLKHECSGNETFSFCGSDCATNCFDESKRHMCQTLCKRGCFCNDGYRRDGAGNCVLPDDCKQWSPNHVTPIFRV